MTDLKALSDAIRWRDDPPPAVEAHLWLSCVDMDTNRTRWASKHESDAFQAARFPAMSPGDILRQQNDWATAATLGNSAFTIVHLDEFEAEMAFAATGEFVFEGWHVFRPNAPKDQRYEGPFDSEVDARGAAARKAFERDCRRG